MSPPHVSIERPRGRHRPFRARVGLAQRSPKVVGGAGGSLQPALAPWVRGVHAEALHGQTFVFFSPRLSVLEVLGREHPWLRGANPYRACPVLPWFQRCHRRDRATRRRSQPRSHRPQ